jgi:hypothetical protein
VAKSTRGNRDHEALRPNQAAVLKLVVEAMRVRGYSALQIASARRLWSNFVQRVDPKVRKPEAPAAALEYTLNWIDGLPTSQREAAADYGVSPGSVSRWFGALVDGLGLEADADAYATLPPPSALREEVSRLLGSPGALQAPPPRPPLSLSADQLRRLAVLPRTGERWQGTRRALTSYVLEPYPFRPDLLMVVHKTSDRILSSRVIDPAADDAEALDLVILTMLEPATGVPRRPRELLLDDEDLAQQLAPVLAPIGTVVRAGPSRYLDDLVDQMETAAASQQRLPPGHLDGERIDPAEVGRFFSAAARLQQAAPWTLADVDQIISVELDRFGVDQLCVSIIGDAGIDRGIIMFRSLFEYLAFSDAAELADLVDHQRVLPTVEIFSLSFQRGAEMDPAARREVLHHGWEVVDPESFPRLLRLDADNIAVPLSDVDFMIAAACADAVSAFTASHPEAFQRPRRDPVAVPVPLTGWPDAPPVRVIAPYPGIEYFTHEEREG